MYFKYLNSCDYSGKYTVFTTKQEATDTGNNSIYNLNILLVVVGNSADARCTSRTRKHNYCANNSNLILQKLGQTSDASLFCDRTNFNIARKFKTIIQGVSKLYRILLSAYSSHEN